MTSKNNLESLARQVRHLILLGTSEAGSGHPTTSLSATDLMTTLFFKFFRADLQNPKNPMNDRLIFSKGHAAPLLYALYAAAGQVSPSEIKSLRLFGSPLEGHPTPKFKYTEVATGSLGQGLSVGVGMALNAKYLDQSSYRTFVLLGDGEMAEGSVWEAMQSASHYKLDNLCGFLDVNRFGQSEETMLGHDIKTYAQRIASFGWEVLTVNGHKIPDIEKALEQLLASSNGRPKMLVAKTEKGKGVSLFEGKEGWHGKPLPKADLDKALEEIGAVDLNSHGTVAAPVGTPQAPAKAPQQNPNLPRYEMGQSVATRKAYGDSLAALGEVYPDLVALDGDTKNSTFSEFFAKKFPKRFFEMYIAEQNMVGAALGLSKRGKIPFVSTFAAFLTRGFDQIRMGAASEANVKYCGSHAGVSIGEDGASQMGLEDLAMFRSIHNSVVFYPSDAVSTLALMEEMIRHRGTSYLRTGRPNTPVIYKAGEKFKIGGSKTCQSSGNDLVTVVGAGITLHEALKAHATLQGEGISIRVIDCYSVKPIDEQALIKAAEETKGIVVVEDHWFDGGLGDAVLNALARTKNVPVIKLAIRQMPSSGKPQELVEKYGISATSIIKAVKELGA